MPAALIINRILQFGLGSAYRSKQCVHSMQHLHFPSHYKVYMHAIFSKWSAKILEDEQ